MSAVKELIRKEPNGTISFGDHTLPEKTKKSDVEISGDIYKVKTYNEVTKLEKNEMLIYESVPGTSVGSFDYSPEKISFSVEGAEDAQITLELTPDTEYDIIISGKDAGKMTTKFNGKLSFSVDLSDGAAVLVDIKKV